MRWSFRQTVRHLGIALVIQASCGCIARLDELRASDAGLQGERPRPSKGNSKPAKPDGETPTGRSDGGQQAPNLDAGVNGCPERTFLQRSDAPEEDDDGITACTPYSVCRPGTFLAEPGAADRDVVCEACAPGTFSRKENANTCTPWRDCLPGEYIVGVGTSSTDRECSPCPPNTTSTRVNVGACTARDECPAGTHQDDTGECAPCAPGEYCAGADTSPQPCEGSLYDDDGDPASPCTEKTTCLAGTRVDDGGTAVTDRTCVTCDPGTFTTDDDAVACKAWTVCAPGTRVTEVGSVTADRRCEPCAPGTFSSADNSARCAPWRECGASEYSSKAPSATTDRECSPCTGSSGAANGDECLTRAFQMVNGVAVMEAENYTATRATNTDAWTRSNVAQTSGGACMVVGPDDGSDWTTNPYANAPRLDYLVRFDRAGNYYAHVRGDSGPPGGGYSDSCYVGVDGVATEWIKFSVHPNDWGWVTYPLGALGAGLHTISILAREDGFRVDKLVVSSSSTKPTDLGPAQSALIVP